MEGRHLGTLLYASLKDVIHNQRSGKMPMSISNTILTGRLNTEQVSIYLRVSVH